MLLWLLEFGFFPAATPRKTVTTGGLDPVMVCSVVCASTPGMSDSQNFHLPLLKKSYGGGDSNPVEIAALSETRFSEKGQLEEVGAGITFFWIGWPKTARRDAGVALAIRNYIVGHLPYLPQGINDRMMSLRLPLGVTPVFVFALPDPLLHFGWA
ncbi:unnamed protein product [Schistocephalus solidus]|uniref:Uncharacterized protein n=1 Tax=Schistocephalus solidus TaxID=70667 RepID=A0A183SBA1_SCHSO|nr:unnamed protein product [Schistocephalus solidus]